MLEFQVPRPTFVRPQPRLGLVDPAASVEYASKPQDRDVSQILFDLTSPYEAMPCLKGFPSVNQLFCVRGFVGAADEAS